MNISDVLVRSLIAGACIGIPAAALRLIIEHGRTVPRVIIGLLGGFAGFSAALVTPSVFAPPWSPYVFYSLVIGLTGVASFVSIIGNTERRERSDQFRTGPRFPGHDK